MFAALEASLKTLVTGAIPNAPVLGTFDFVDFTAQGAPTVGVRVAWEGLAKRGQHPEALTFDQRFSVSVIVNQIRVANTSRQAATAGIRTIIARLIGWLAEQDVQPEIEFPSAPAEAGGLWAYTIIITAPNTIIRAQ